CAKSTGYQVKRHNVCDSTPWQDHGVFYLRSLGNENKFSFLSLRLVIKNLRFYKQKPPANSPCFRPVN
ncbi:MAG: hypothetical protein ABH832_01540, partial [bacterium]